MPLSSGGPRGPRKVPPMSLKPKTFDKHKYKFRLAFDKSPQVFNIR